MIEVRYLSKSFGDVRALDQVSFSVSAGDSLVILGPSGSGKTTLLRLVAGLEIPDQGEIFIDGKLASEPGWVLSPYQRGIGFVFQTPALWPHMTVAKNILFGLNGMPQREASNRLDELLVQTGLAGLERRYPSQLSSGQARRVALARTLAPKPRGLLMDEPLTNVDPDLKGQLLAMIKKNIGQDGTCLLYVTHDADEAREISERVLVLKDGCLDATSTQCNN
jgi:ABC-type Fe3+/spermidine/putrescine transport system ATPase subunit